MPPNGPLLKNDGPACRVCGCTENNACVYSVRKAHPGDPGGPHTTLTSISCSWVQISGNDHPPHLCSACAGTAADAMEAMQRGMNILLKQRGDAAAARVVAMARALKVRYDARLRWEAGQTITPMEANALGVRDASNH